MRNGVQLITYVDRLGRGNLDTIHGLLGDELSGAFTGVHLLPFYTPFDGADAGFDPTDHTVVDPRLGNWAQVAEIASTYDVTADLIVNHVSDQSPQFKDFVQHGADSQYAGMFLEYDTLFPDEADDRDLGLIYRPRPGLPFTDKTMADGSTRRMWTTFTPQQIDLDVRNPQARRYLSDVIDRFAAAGIAQVRLDAVGYAIKTPGTSCFMIPETVDFIAELGAEIRKRGMESLLEIHSHYSDQVGAGRIADRVYDFALPPLILHALYTGSAGALRSWLEISPRNAITVLDTHDGIGVIDAGPHGNREGLLTPDQIDELVEGIHEHSNGESRLATGAAASNLDLYQVNCTYYSALGGDDDRYLLARLAQFLCPGIPQVYYAGLLACRNDMELLEATGVGRDINRPYLSSRQIAGALRRPVVQHLLAMARFRNSEPAFGGEFTLDESTPNELRLRWNTPAASLDARIDFAAVAFSLMLGTDGARRVISSWDEF